MKHSSLVFAIALALCSSSFAKLTSFPEHNFSMEVPDGWKATNPSPANTVAFFKTADETKGLVLMATIFPADKLATASLEMIDGAKKAAVDKGIQIEGERDMSIDGVLFHTFTSRMPGSLSISFYMGTAGEMSYSLQAFSKTSDASSDADLSAAINSFKLLSQPKPQSGNVAPPDTAAERFGRMTGTVLGAVFLGGCVIILIGKARKN